ncbi:hypothetical protein MTR67_050598 [Solanum verrucosum]|uniref:Uncharacterized protein n=1 Tax=Solanum verrucosum TaxID=315347 RepID=A0AAF1A1D6_SOLVR|nr:hypothetical protein MTR67_050598 [Solanum verrucosum]
MAQVAEIHVMQKLHKEKMKTTSKIEMTNKKLVGDEDNKTCSSGKCCSWLEKKVNCVTRQLLSCARNKPVICDYKDST